jgi:hypothetical protein
MHAPCVSVPREYAQVLGESLDACSWVPTNFWSRHARPSAVISGLGPMGVAGALDTPLPGVDAARGGHGRPRLPWWSACIVWLFGGKLLKPAFILIGGVIGSAHRARSTPRCLVQTIGGLPAAYPGMGRRAHRRDDALRLVWSFASPWPSIDGGRGRRRQAVLACHRRARVHARGRSPPPMPSNAEADRNCDHHRRRHRYRCSPPAGGRRRSGTGRAG